MDQLHSCKSTKWFEDVSNYGWHMTWFTWLYIHHHRGEEAAYWIWACIQRTWRDLWGSDWSSQVCLASMNQLRIEGRSLTADIFPSLFPELSESCLTFQSSWTSNKPKKASHKKISTFWNCPGGRVGDQIYTCAFCCDLVWIRWSSINTCWVQFGRAHTCCLSPPSGMHLGIKRQEFFEFRKN